MKTMKKMLLSNRLLALVLFLGVGVTQAGQTLQMQPAVGAPGQLVLAENNPCGMSSNPCNPCAMNPCQKKMNPCAKNPCAKNPCAKNPCAMNPCAKNPCAKNPCAKNPCAKNPCAMNPCAKNPCAKNPCAKNPCAKNPCAKNPCAKNPCAKNPCAKNPCAMNPCAKNPCGVSGQNSWIDPALITRPAGTRLYAKKSRSWLVKRGEKLFKDSSLSSNGMTCNACHSTDALFKASFAQPYPHRVAMADDRAGLKRVHLDEFIQFCLLAPMASKTLPWESADLAALTAYMADVKQQGFIANMKANPCAMKHKMMNPCANKMM